MLAITLIAAIACALLIAFGYESASPSGGAMTTLGMVGLLLLIVILHAARIGLVTLS